MKDDNNVNRPREIQLGDRVVKLREELDMSQSDLARAAKMNQRTLSAIERNKVKRTRFVVDLAQALFSTAEYLETGNITSPAIKNMARGLPEVDRFIPIVEWDEILDNTSCKIFSSKDRDMIPGLKGKPGTLALTVENDAMKSSSPDQRSYWPGDLVVVDTDSKPQSGDIVVFIDQERKASGLRQLIKDAGRFFLRPFNTQYELIILTEAIQILGVVSYKIADAR